MRRGSHSRKSPSMVRKSAGAEGKPLGAQRKMKQPVCGRQDKVRTAHMVYATCPVHHILSYVSPDAEGSWVLESGGWGMDPGRGQLLAVKRKPEGQEEEAPQLGTFSEETWSTIDQGTIVE